MDQNFTFASNRQGDNCAMKKSEKLRPWLTKAQKKMFMKDLQDNKGRPKISLILTKSHKEDADRMCDSSIYPMFKLSVISDLEKEEKERMVENDFEKELD